MVILMLCLIIFSIVVIVNVFAGLFEWSIVADRIINYTTNLNPYILAAILFLVLVIALIIFIFEFYRRKIKIANISTDQSGKTMVSLKTASNQVRESLTNIEDIFDPKVKIIPKHDGIIINTSSKLSTGINVVDKIKEIRESVSNFASNNLGFKVLQSNYTAIGFVSKKVKEFKEIKKEKPEEVKIEPETEEQAEKKME
jgi:hypothetical protein